MRPDDDDATLLRAHLAGDRDAFGELVRRHQDRLWAVALRTLGDREEAADALQDALINAYRAADRFRGDAAVTTWLHRIVVNACLDRLRRRAARPTVALPTQPGDGPDSALERAATAAAHGLAAPTGDPELAMVVQAALAQLPTEQRVALILLDMLGFSVAEIAALLGVAEGTVKSRCARGRARLAVLLGHLRTAPSGNPGGDSSVESGSADPAGSVGSAGSASQGGAG